MHEITGGDVNVIETASSGSLGRSQNVIETASSSFLGIPAADEFPVGTKHMSSLSKRILFFSSPAYCSSSFGVLKHQTQPQQIGDPDVIKENKYSNAYLSSIQQHRIDSGNATSSITFANTNAAIWWEVLSD
ncbi:hypothetical protein HELRODRAFT_182089 [Helobdella robusta]|uniref:Uncharacterized protein n=1 Tax=Helobdella robusta TaxID=6412 RepID=T1FHQ2_HELRO|nr:hypothetical protein HELRODRAFT_182089 [Helobdella robusta]ESN91233.1 hypothetical protein HELRODRAFT_182089 [Helobdella robusta]